MTTPIIHLSTKARHMFVRGAIAVALVASLAGCAQVRQAADAIRQLDVPVEQDGQPAESPMEAPVTTAAPQPSGSYTVDSDCESLSVVISGYPAGSVAYFNTDGAPPLHLNPSSDAHTFPLHVERWGLYVRDSAGTVLVDLDGQPTDC